MNRILDLTALELGRQIKAGAVSAPEAVQAALERIVQVEPDLNAYVTVDGDRAMEQAGRVQRRIESGELTGPLAGVPVAIKDNLCTKDLKTTCSSRILENFVPTYTAYAVQKLEEAGAVILSKTNMDEFAMGSTTETSYFGQTRNPWNRDHVPGGSSGGSCAAVAAGECFLALGSDTGGSIRQPSSFCGVTGIKPTYGTVSRWGLIAYGSSLDQVGPVAGNISDCAAALEAISGHDPRDSTSMAVSYTHLFDPGRAVKSAASGRARAGEHQNRDRETRETAHGAGTPRVHFPYVLRRSLQGDQGGSGPGQRHGPDRHVLRRGRDSARGDGGGLQVHFRVCPQPLQRHAGEPAPGGRHRDQNRSGDQAGDVRPSARKQGDS